MSVPVSWPDVIGIGVLCLALPALSIAQLGILKDLEIQRIQVYVSSALTLLLLGGGCLALGLLRGGWAALGLGVAPGASAAGWAASLTVGGLAVMFVFRGFASALHVEESPLLRAILPRTVREKSAFVVLSLAAGVGEELAYRGYAVTLLAGWVHPVLAVMVAAAAFGVMHAYQGAIGIVRTTVLGVLLGWGFLASHSLWPPMLAHAVLDVLAGVVLAPWLVVPEDAIGVERTGEAPPTAP
jgi:membrane protease YdiL (CAAX protease family)